MFSPGAIFGLEFLQTDGNPLFRFLPPANEVCEGYVFTQMRVQRTN